MGYAVITERIRGYSMLWRRCGAGARGRIEGARVAYLSQRGNVLPVDSAVAVVAGEIIALIPEAPTPPRRSRRLAESRLVSFLFGVAGPGAGELQ